MNCFCAASARESRSVMSLNDRASDRCSLLPSTGARTSRIAGCDLLGRVLQMLHRASDRTGDDRAGEQPDQEHRNADRGEVEHDAPHGAVGRRHALGHTDGPGDAAPLQERRGRREDARVECLAAARQLGGAARERLGDLGPVESAGRAGSAPALSASTRAFASTTTTRPRTSFATLRTSAWRLGRSSGASRSEAVAASTSAWLRACDCTSEWTRRFRLIASGTSKARIARTSR